MIPKTRVRIFHPGFNPGQCIVYWMISARRTQWNHGLEHAIEIANEKNLPLVVVEPLALNHGWVNDRSHTFVIQGMLDNKNAFEDSPITYIPYVESRLKEGKGLLEEWMNNADTLVIDDFPTYHPRRVLEIAIKMAKCEIHCVDSNGFIALRSEDRAFTTAYSLRRHLHKTILTHMQEFPHPNPISLGQNLPRFDKKISGEIFSQSNTPFTSDELIENIGKGKEAGINALSTLEIDHTVSPVVKTLGGALAAQLCWDNFLENKLMNYSEERNKPESKGSSGLSPYLHFGHISIHHILSDIFQKHSWDISEIILPNNGRRAGWWNLPSDVEGFLDQIITWRDLGFLHCTNVENHDHFDSLPEWAKHSLKIHQNDPRPYIYSFDEFENAKTHDDLWNAAQIQLRKDGIIHNYLRMLWGKKILEWSPTPEIAMEYMLALNDKWALDGRDPNSYTGIGWVLGKFDRGWTERSVFGKIRCMTTDSTKRKYKTKGYIEQYSNSSSVQTTFHQKPVDDPASINYQRRN